MKKISIALAAIVLFSSSTLQAQNEPKDSPPPVAEKKAAPELPFKTDSENFSYMVGLEMAKIFSTAEIKIDAKAFAQAFEDYADEKNWKITKAQNAELSQKFSQKMQAAQRKKASSAGNANIEKGKKFLAENAKKEGVKVLPSGLQYKVLKSGTGKSPTKTDRFRANYKGTLIDGTVFDQSKPGKPLELGVTQVIPGWIEALQLMKEGDKWMLYIPSDLAYGAQQRSREITPHSTLVFEMELLKVLPAQ